MSIPRRARARAAAHRRVHLRMAFFEPLEARKLLSITALPPDEPSSGYFATRMQQLGHVPKPDFYGPVTTLPGGPEASPLTITVEGITFDENGMNNGGVLSIPPDPHGAVGPGHLVSVVNSSIEFHTKAGAQEFSGDLQAFFAPLAPLTDCFDPKVIYDQYNGRFVVSALEVTDTAFGGTANTSRIMVAVSDDNDPNGVWRYHAINSKLNISGDRFADFPGLGYDASGIYITANMFSFGLTPTFAGSRLWIIDKNPFYTAAGPNAAVVTVHDPSTSAGLPSQASTLQPAKMIGTGPAGMGTFLVNTSFISAQNEVMSIIKITSPLSSPSFSNTFLSLTDIHNQAVPMPTAPQMGGAMNIHTGSQRALDAVWRNNQLYVTNTVNPNSGADAGQATAHWSRFNANGVASPTFGDQGNISGEDIGAGTHTFYPSIAVDNNGNLAMGFAASGSTIFPGAYYTIRAPGDPPGTVQSSGTLAAGLASYVRTFGDSRNRWGDYTATVIDPVDDSAWIFNQYADTQGTPTSPPPENGRWRTRWGGFSPVAVIPPAPGTPDLIAASDSGVSNSDDNTNVTTPTFTGAGQTGLTVKIFADGIQVGSGVVAGGVYTITTSALSDGMKSITAVQNNGTNDSPPSPALSVTIDTLAPSLSGTPAFNFLTAPHKLTYGFSENVGPTLSSADYNVVLLPANTTQAISVAYAAATNIATITFPGAPAPGVLADGDYRSTLMSAGVTDIAGNPLNVPAPEADHVLDFFFLLADANHDRRVNLIDFNILAGNFGLFPGASNYGQADFNYDTNVNLIDFNIIAGRFGNLLGPSATTRTSPPLFSQLAIPSRRGLLDLIESSEESLGK